MGMRKKQTRQIVAMIVVFTSMLVFSPTLLRAQAGANPEVSRLLSEAAQEAAVLSKDADDMEALTRTDASWESHAVMLDAVKNHVNDLARMVSRLESARALAAPWQQEAVDRTVPLLKRLAANTTAAINHLRQNQIRPTTTDYTQYLQQNRETAHQLADMISSFVQYGQAQAKLEKLEQKLEVASR